MKIRSKEHLEFVAEQPCIITGRRGEGVQAHHLLRAGGKALATKACDSLTVPLYYEIHDALHRNGNEVVFFANHGLDYELVIKFAEVLCQRSPCKKVKKLESVA